MKKWVKFSILFLVFFTQSYKLVYSLSPTYKKAVSKLFKKTPVFDKELLDTDCKMARNQSCSLLKLSLKPNKKYQPIPIFTGIAQEDYIYFAISRPINAHLQYVLINKNTYKVSPAMIAPQKSLSLDHQIDHVSFAGLKNNEEYHLAVFDYHLNLLDIRDYKHDNFKNKNELKFAIASCMYDSFEKLAEGIWDSLISKKPDVLLLIGDNVYVDIGDFRERAVNLSWFWKRFFETRNQLKIFKSKRLQPSLAIWDDHDYGLNNGGVDFALKKQAKEIFEIFFPRPFKKIEGPGMSYLTDIGNTQLLFLDSRWNRQSNENKNGAHLGDFQLAFIKSQLFKSPKKLLIIKGDQFFGGYHQFESYQGNHPKEFAKFLKLIKLSSREKILISGDRHLSEVIYSKEDKIYEITSSPIHSKIFPKFYKHGDNPLRIKGTGAHYNYKILETNDSSKAAVQCIDHQDKIVYETEVEL